MIALYITIKICFLFILTGFFTPQDVLKYKGVIESVDNIFFYTSQFNNMLPKGSVFF